MKRLLMLLTTFCLLLMTTALAETEAEWNAKCEWKTGTGTTLYAVTHDSCPLPGLSPPASPQAARPCASRQAGAPRRRVQARRRAS